MYLLHCRTVWRTGFKRFSDEWNRACEAATPFEKEVLSLECIW